jgi:YfiH family protein
VPFIESGDIRYFIFDNLNQAGIIHGIFSRRGGVSPSPWESLNVGGTVGDDINRVQQNRIRIFEILNLSLQSVYDVWQVHSNHVVCSDSPRPSGSVIRKGDAIITNKPGISLFMRFADCVPIFLFDPVKSVVGIVHAGWLGTVEKIVHAAIKRMEQIYLSNPSDIIASIGPSIGPDHYEIGEDVISKVRMAFNNQSKNFIKTINGSNYFDLWAANIHLLTLEGVSNIELSQICTVCHREEWYSHRAENGRTGRFGAVITLSGA